MSQDVYQSMAALVGISEVFLRGGFSIPTVLIAFVLLMLVLIFMVCNSVYVDYLPCI